MASEVIITLTGLFCTTVSSIVTFFFTKKKYNTEVEAQQIQNMRDAFDIYRQTMEENLSSQRRILEETISSQNEKIESLKKENDILRDQVNQLQMQVVALIGKKIKSTTRACRPKK